MDGAGTVQAPTHRGCGLSGVSLKLFCTPTSFPAEQGNGLRVLQGCDGCWDICRKEMDGWEKGLAARARPLGFPSWSSYSPHCDHGCLIGENVTQQPWSELHMQNYLAV